jgi:hypothetical protein
MLLMLILARALRLSGDSVNLIHANRCLSRCALAYASRSHPCRKA